MIVSLILLSLMRELQRLLESKLSYDLLDLTQREVLFRNPRLLAYELVKKVALIFSSDLRCNKVSKTKCH